MPEADLKAQAEGRSALWPRLANLVLAGAGLALLFALFRIFGATGAELVDALLRTPVWLYAVLIAIVLLNNLLGVFKWRAAIRWLDPGHPLPPTMAAFEASVAGALYGLLLLPQVMAAATRWSVLKRLGGRGSLAVSSTFYEQLCDLFMLAAAAAAGLAVLAFGLGTGTGLTLLALAFFVALFAMRPAFATGALLARGVAGIAPRRMSAALATLAEVLRRLGAAPWRISLTMMAFSALRLLLQIGHGVAVGLVFVPAVPWLLVAAGVPPGVLAVAIPFAPGGLGVAEWTWSGMLVLAGALPPAAAVASLASRILYMLSVGVVAVALLLRRALSRSKAM